ncbi:tyrosine-protein kinase, non-receptor Jak2, partial [Tanacetum coccineum]
PTMARVVEELEKALILQGGVVSPVHIPSSINVTTAPNETIVEDGPKEDDNGVTVDSNVPENEPEDAKDPTIDKGAEVVGEDKLDNVAREYNSDAIHILGTPSETTTEEQSSLVPVSDSVEGESVHDTKDAQKESSNNEPSTTDDINSIKESTMLVENKDDNQTKTDIELLDNEDHSSVILESGSRNFEALPNESHADEALGDELQHLRIPFDKIKFGNEIDVRGYGSLFEGEYDNQKVALKRLNITNLANIKPKLLAEILTVARFRKHPSVVALIGFCDEKSNEIILVYEYVSSGNLADKMNKHLTTIQRLEICLDAARGLDYLHTSVDDSTPGIVHGHIKLSKILLNSDSNSSRFKAKVSGFGLSKLLPGDVQIAPRSTDPVTKVSDVYTFGVLLLEVLCGVPELIDTDDYQERHVTEVVPKRVEQNNLRKIVHFDIRDEIKTEALETYGKIACRCVMKSPEERPTMTEVVVELEKALRLQGGEVSDVYILGSSNGNGIIERTADDHDQEGDGTGETISSYIAEDDSKVTEETVDITARGIAAPNQKQTLVLQEDLSCTAPISDIIDAESIPETTHIKDAQEESSNDVLMSTNDRETTKEVVDELVSSDKSITNGEHKDGNESTKLATSSEASNGHTGVSDHVNQEAQNSGFLKSGSRNFDYLHQENHAEVIELEDLRIPFDEIKFGKKIDMRGYGTLFEGEYNNQQVALKRLNITNLNNIKPKLLDEILTVARFRKHPNVVALIGFCDEKSNEIILVYEYVRSGNLADKMSKHLNTIQRLEICLDAARGLEYLHTGVDESTPGIVHGHIKLSKILLNSELNSSRFKAKVSGFGFSRLLPGDVQIAPRSMDPAYEVTGELMKESDVYTFGVLLLEVLCGVPELVDTDDYQERHVTELVPKRLEQDMLRKIVHFDIRNEIKTEALETYAKIACRSVIKNPEERPTMTEVVIELEKALRLQGGEVSSIHILGGRIGNGLTKETVIEVDQPEDDKPEEESKVVEETIVDDKPEEESKVVDETIATDETEESKVIEQIAEDIEDAKKENDESAEEITVDTKPKEEPIIIVENEIDNDSIDVPTPEESKNDADSSSSKLLHSFHRPVLDSEDGQEVAEITDNDDAKQEKDNQDDTESKEEITESKISPMEITTDQQVQNDGNHSVFLKGGAEPELSVNTRGDFNDFSTDENLIPVEKPEFSEIKRSNSACSESSNGDGTTPTDYLLPKSPTNDTIKETVVAVPGCVSSVTELFFTEGNFGINWYHALPGSEVDALVKRIKGQKWMKESCTLTLRVVGSDKFITVNTNARTVGFPYSSCVVLHQPLFSVFTLRSHDWEVLSHHATPVPTSQPLHRNNHHAATFLHNGNLITILSFQTDNELIFQTHLPDEILRKISESHQLPAPFTDFAPVEMLYGSIMDGRIVQVSRYLLLEVTSSSLLILTLEPQETGHFKFLELQDARDRILSRLDATESLQGAILNDQDFVRRFNTYRRQHPPPPQTWNYIHVQRNGDEGPGITVWVSLE